MPNNYVKDPASLLDYTWGWEEWLAEVSDTISSATVTLPDGLTADGAPTVGATAVTQRVKGGTLDATYEMVCQITTVGGLIDERTIYLTIRDQ